MSLLTTLKYRILVASVIGIAIMATILIIKPYQSEKIYDNELISTNTLFPSGTLLNE